MKPNLAPRVQAIVLLLLVATSGALAGIVGDRLLSDRQQPAPAEPPAGAEPRPWGPRGDVRYGERLIGALDLSPAQRSAIDSIVAEQQARVRELNEEVRPRFRAITEQTRSGIEGVLTDEQRVRLRELREERVRAMRDAGRLRGLRPDLPDDVAPGEGRRRDGMRDRPLLDPELRERALRDPAVRDSLRQERLRQRRGDEAAGRPPAEPAPDTTLDT